MTSFEQFIENPVSHKVVLAWIEPSYRLQGWSAYSVDVYKISPPDFVVKLSQEGNALTKVAGIPAAEGEWSYVEQEGIVYLWPLSSSDPNIDRIRADFRLFFSSGPFILPSDLSIGPDVEYLPLLDSTSQFGYEFDSEQLGIMLEGQGQISLQNNHGFFDDIWEKYFWENKPCYIHSWSPEINPDQAKIIYKGFIKGKSFSSQSVSFSLTDFISKLKDPVPLTTFSLADGIISDSEVGTFKRRIYGRVDGLRTLSLDQTLDGFTLTGTIIGNADSKIITGTGTSFLSELSPEDEFLSAGDERYKIETIISDTQATVSRKISPAISGSVIVKPEVAYRRKNRRWHIAGHPLKKLRAVITSIVSRNRFVVDSILGMYAGDVLVLNGTQVTIRRISGNTIILRSNVPSTPLIGDYFYRYPVQSVNVGTRDFVLFRDYELSNNPEAVLELDELAEFNATEGFPFSGTATFTNGSRTITGTSTAFDVDFKPRDWINKDGDLTWYEVLAVLSATEMTIRTNYSGATGSGIGLKKNVSYLNEKSILTVNCYGKSDDNTEDGAWIQTTPDIVKDLLNDQALLGQIDVASFELANIHAPELASFKLPLEFGSSSPITTIETINQMTITSLGALFSNQDFNIAYSIVNTQKPPELLELGDADIIDFDVVNNATEISREIIGRYRHRDADRYTGKEATLTKSRVNPIVDQFMDTKKTRTIDFYLYNEDEVNILVRRYGLLYETGSTRVVVRTKLNLSRKNIGDKIYLNLDRLYKRFGSDGSRRKISMVTGVKKDGMNCMVTLDDFGNIFTKVATFASEGSSTFAVATDNEKVRNGYFTFDDTGLCDQTLTYRINLFG